MEVLKQHSANMGHQKVHQHVYHCTKYSGLVSPVYSGYSSEAEDEQPESRQQRAVQFYQCPRPPRSEPVCKKLRCPTPPVRRTLLDEEDDDDSEEEEDEDEAEQIDTIHADRLRRCSLSSEDSSDSEDSEVFYCE